MEIVAVPAPDLAQWTQRVCGGCGGPMQTLWCAACDRVHDRPDWDTYFLMLAQVVALRGDCRRSQVGCVVVDAHRMVVAEGYNGAPAAQAGCLSGACPRGRLSYEQQPGLAGYSGAGECIALHAEQNALVHGSALAFRGGTAYITRSACSTCATMLAGSGIARVVYIDTDDNGQQVRVSAALRVGGTRLAGAS